MGPTTWRIHLFFVIVLVCWTGLPTVDAFNRPYQESVYKYCGETGDSCMFSSQCCRGFECKWLDSAYSNQGTCRSEKAREQPSEESGRASCNSNLDCPADKCCKSFKEGIYGQASFYCSQDCSSWTLEQKQNEREYPPVGNYRGSHFWSRWQRRAGAGLE